MTQSLCQRSPTIYSKEPCTLFKFSNVNSALILCCQFSNELILRISKEPSDIHEFRSKMHSYATWRNHSGKRALQYGRKSPVLCRKSRQIYSRLIPRCIHMWHDSIHLSKEPYSLFKRALYFVKRALKYAHNSFRDAFKCDMTQSKIQIVWL